jgi:hypothetical protein
LVYIFTRIFSLSLVAVQAERPLLELERFVRIGVQTELLEKLEGVRSNPKRSSSSVATLKKGGVL